MYWANPIIKITTLDQPSPDHRLFYCHNVPVSQIQPLQTLQQLCDLANQRLDKCSKNEFTNDTDSHDFVTNIVKINQMVASLKNFGCVKPMLLQYTGTMPMTPGTGDSRLKAIECVPEITTVPAIVSTHRQYSRLFDQYKQIDSIDQLMQVCNTTSDFYVRFTDKFADYGIDWFEYCEDKVSVPATEWCLYAIQNYINSQSDTFRFETNWFDNLIDWEFYSK